MDRDNCSNKDVCGKTGHVRDQEGNWQRCQCLVGELEKRRLGPFYCSEPVVSTPLVTVTEKTCLLEGSLQSLRPHIAGAITFLESKGKTVRYMDAYRLIEIYLEKDPEFQTTAEGTEADLLIFLVGFGDPRNRYLPELLIQAIDRREVLDKPTWVLLGIPLTGIATKYSEQLFDKLSAMKPVRLKS